MANIFVPLIISFALTFHENVKADKNFESQNIFVSLEPSNFSNVFINKADNLTRTTVRINARRKAVLILHSDPALRTAHDKKNVTSLYYQDYDDNGEVLNTMWMYNLKDVAEFFKVFLDTEICYGRCK